MNKEGELEWGRSQQIRALLPKPLYTIAFLVP